MSRAEGADIGRFGFDGGAADDDPENSCSPLLLDDAHKEEEGTAAAAAAPPIALPGRIGWYRKRYCESSIIVEVVFTFRGGKKKVVM